MDTGMHLFVLIDTKNYLLEKKLILCTLLTDHSDT